MPQSNEAIQDRGPVVLAVTIAFLTASTVFVVLRLISRIGIVRKVSKDDYFIILAWVSPIPAATRSNGSKGAMLMRGSSLPLGFPSPSAMEHRLDWEGMRLMSNQNGKGP